MKEIPDESIDMILCDLPYGTTACSWDSIIPFEPLWEQYERIIKEDGVIVLFGSQPFTTKLINSNIKNFKEELIWLKNKAGSGFQLNQKHQKIHENIIVFSLSNTYTYNPQKWLIAEKEFITQRKTFSEVEVGNNIYGKIKRTRKPDTGERNPLSIVSCRVPFTPQKSKSYSDEVDLRLHPTQKPVALLEYLIKTYTNEDETVLDNCAGSMSTVIACLNTKRKCIAMEKDKKYFQIGCNRVKQHILDNRMDLFYNQVYGGSVLWQNLEIELEKDTEDF
jgi:site-specific DNA-methyltransferase (adenine-specific)